MDDEIEDELKKIVIFDPKNLNQIFNFDNFDIKIQINLKPQKDQIIKDKSIQEEEILI